jgi:hypothetical protein
LTGKIGRCIGTSRQVSPDRIGFPTMRSDDFRPALPSQARRYAMWTLALLPALVTLWLVLPLRTITPYGDAWAIVSQYQAWQAGDYGWQDLFRPHNQHPSVIGKLLYFAVLQWGRGEVALLPVATWGMSVMVSFSLLTLLRWCRAVTDRALPVVWFLVNTVLFSLTQGHVWTWEFLVFNAVPGTALVAGLAVVAVPERLSMTARTLLAAVLSLAAVFGFGSGFLVPCLLLPMLLLKAQGHHGWGRARLAVLAGAWLAAMGVATLLAFGVIGPVEAPSMPAAGGRVGELASKPADVVRFILVMLGRGWGQGTALDPTTQSALAGVGIVVAALVAAVLLARCGGWWTGLASRLWPWLALGAYGGANIALICWGRMAESLVAALDDRYVAFTQFVTLGVLGALLVGVRRLEETGRLPGVRRALGGLVVPVVTGWLLIEVLVNFQGWQALRCLHQYMQAQRAGLVFAKILPIDQMPFWNGLVQASRQGELAIFLADQGKLRKVTMLEEPEVARVKQNAALVASKARLLSLEVGADGGWRIRGFCAGNEGRDSRPSLVAISLATEGGAERWVGIGAHDMVDNFFENEWMRNRYREHYFGWECRLPAEIVAGLQTGVLRAYAYEVDRQAFRKIGGAIATAGLPKAGPHLRVAGE